MSLLRQAKMTKIPERPRGMADQLLEWMFDVNLDRKWTSYIPSCINSNVRGRIQLAASNWTDPASNLHRHVQHAAKLKSMG